MGRQFEVYQHYKGGLYTKLCEARHSETGEMLVVYCCAASGEVWCRPKAMFEEQVTDDGYCGPRFIAVPYTADKEKRKSVRMLGWLLPLLLGMGQMAQAEVRGMPVEQLKKVSATAPSGTGAGRLPAAVPYTQIEMPPLPEPVVRGRIYPAVSATETPPPTAAATVTATLVSATAVSATLPPAINTDGCRAALRLVGEMGVTAYQQRPQAAVMALVAASVLADDVVRAGNIPNLSAIRKARDDLPWYGPLRSELRQAVTAVDIACTSATGTGVPNRPVKIDLPRPE